VSFWQDSIWFSIGDIRPCVLLNRRRNGIIAGLSASHRMPQLRIPYLFEKVMSYNRYLQVSPHHRLISRYYSFP
jgi:hypothetical protein